MGEENGEYTPLHGQYGAKPLPLFKPDKALVSKVSAGARIVDSGLHGSVPVIDVPVLPATASTLQDYADVYAKTSAQAVPVRISQWPGKGARSVLGGTGGGTTQGTFTATWTHDHVCNVRTESVDGNYRTGWRHGEDIFLQDANYHPDGTQVFSSLDGEPFLLVLSKHSDDVTISPAHFVAFYCSGTETLSLHAGVWHQAVFPIHNSARLYTKQGRVHGVVCIDFLHEFGVRLRIPRAFRAPPTNSPIPTHLISLPADLRKRSTKPSTYEEDCARLHRPFWAEEASEEGVRAFGALLKVPPKEGELSPAPWPSKERRVVFGDEAGLRSAAFSVEWEEGDEEHHSNSQRQLLSIVQGRWSRAEVTHSNATSSQDPNDAFVIRLLQSRIDGPQVLFPREREPYLIVLATCVEDSEEPDISSLRAFQIPPGMGLRLEQCVWASSPIPIHNCGQLPFLRIHSAVDARKEFSLSEENLPPICVAVPRTSSPSHSPSLATVTSPQRPRASSHAL